jgi:hypothetical protein
VPNNVLGPVETNWADRRRSPGNNSAASAITTPANYASDASMDARLAAARPSTYTPSVLNMMSINDKVYALRTIDDAGSI